MCGQCVPMESAAESICCQENEDIGTWMHINGGGAQCVTFAPWIQASFLDRITMEQFRHCYDIMFGAKCDVDMNE